MKSWLAFGSSSYWQKTTASLIVGHTDRGAMCVRRACRPRGARPPQTWRRCQWQPRPVTPLAEMAHLPRELAPSVQAWCTKVKSKRANPKAERRVWLVNSPPARRLHHRELSEATNKGPAAGIAMHAAPSLTGTQLVLCRTLTLRWRGARHSLRNLVDVAETRRSSASRWDAIFTAGPECLAEPLCGRSET